MPALERPDAAAATGVAATTLVDWSDGSDPYPVVGGLLRPDGCYAVSDSAWACTSSSSSSTCRAADTRA